MPSRSSKKYVIAVVGPTAVGKTAVAIRLALHFRTEIVSADSRQIYRELGIGTAKPSLEEMSGVRHHLIDSHSITEDYDAAAFAKDARVAIDAILTGNDYALLCGGSGLYLKALLEGFDDIPAIPDGVRMEIQTAYESNGIEWLRKQMEELDPDHYATIDQRNPQRLMRALEVRIGTGKSIASYRGQRDAVNLPFEVIYVGLELPRHELYDRIDARMDDMIQRGLFEEAASFFKLRHLNALQTVGYQEIFDFMQGLYDRDEAIRLLKRNSRRYAKRQLTWFKRNDAIKWFSPDDLTAILNYIVSKTSGT